MRKSKNNDMNGFLSKFHHLPSISMLGFGEKSKSSAFNLTPKYGWISGRIFASLLGISTSYANTTPSKISSNLKSKELSSRRMAWETLLACDGCTYTIKFASETLNPSIDYLIKAYDYQVKKVGTRLPAGMKIKRWRLAVCYWEE